MAEQYNFRRSEAINLFYSTINARMDQEGLGQRTDLAETKHELRARPYKLDYAPKVDAATGNPYILNITEEEDQIYFVDIKRTYELVRVYPQRRKKIYVSATRNKPIQILFIRHFQSILAPFRLLRSEWLKEVVELGVDIKAAF
ncbi:MAG: hypothetical protein EZS28_005044 [Streblomastix strix]|uniref:Uncharacterized protein n=1 Tax=Streblomastix strix TaxID=222440 RepID=A0A5J4WXA8_9EUKA|nr:MAG: hypothetical protein EZS28_005044 [Streblomastix strix]